MSNISALCCHPTWSCVWSCPSRSITSRQVYWSRRQGFCIIINRKCCKIKKQHGSWISKIIILHPEQDYLYIHMKKTVNDMTNTENLWRNYADYYGLINNITRTIVNIDVYRLERYWLKYIKAWAKWEYQPKMLMHNVYRTAKENIKIDQTMQLFISCSLY